MRTSLRLVALALLAVLPACKLEEVTTADAEDVLVVEALLRARSQPQLILLHRALQGTVVGGEPGASVVVIDPDGGEHTFTQLALAACARVQRPGDIDAGGDTLVIDSLTIRASCYVGPQDLDVQPGGTYELRVSTTRGETVRGRTTVPGDFQLLRPAVDGICSLRPRTNLPVEWTASDGAWSYFSTLTLDGMQDALALEGISVANRIELTAVSISEADTTVVVPSQFGLFEATDLAPGLAAYLQGGLPNGTDASLSVSAMDRNYVNAVRGGSFNPSGSTRISSVVGDGVGVFGSLVTRHLAVVVNTFTGKVLPSCLPD